MADVAVRSYVVAPDRDRVPVSVSSISSCHPLKGYSPPVASCRRQDARRGWRERKPMQLGMIGLGRMGANLVRRLQADGHDCVVYDVNPSVCRGARGGGRRSAPTSLAGAGRRSLLRRAQSGSWCQAPSLVASSMSLRAMLGSGDTIIDGGNSYYRDDVDRARALEPRGVEYVDVGTSGGIYGRERGFCLDDRRQRGARGAARAGVPLPRTRGRCGAANRASRVGSRRLTPSRGTRLPALRRAWSRTLREDDPQRDRVRGDGRVRRGS